VFFAPVAIPLFVVVAVYDRIGGRLGIEASWEPAVRWCLLAGVVLAATSGFLALRTVTVSTSGLPSSSVTVPATSGLEPPNIATSATFTGSRPCGSSALEVTLGGDFYTSLLNDGPPTATPDVQEIVRRCTRAAGRRMVASEISLAGAFTACLMGVGIGRRYQAQQPRRHNRGRVPVA
jgi:hypothetical protein